MSKKLAIRDFYYSSMHLRWSVVDHEHFRSKNSIFSCKIDDDSAAASGGKSPQRPGDGVGTASPMEGDELGKQSSA